MNEQIIIIIIIIVIIISCLLLCAGTAALMPIIETLINCKPVARILHVCCVKSVTCLTSQISQFYSITFTKYKPGGHNRAIPQDRCSMCTFSKSRHHF